MENHSLAYRVTGIAIKLGFLEPYPKHTSLKEPTEKVALAYCHGNTMASSPTPPVGSSGLVMNMDRSQPREFSSRDRDGVGGMGGCAGQARRLTHSKNTAMER